MENEPNKMDKMENMFDGMESDLPDLNPRVRQEAIRIAKELVAKGFGRDEAKERAIKEAQERYFDLEG